MKTFLGWGALVNLSLLAACGGVSSIGGSDAPNGSGGAHQNSGMAGSKAMVGAKNGGAVGNMVEPKGGSHQGGSGNGSGTPAGSGSINMGSGMTPSAGAAPLIQQCMTSEDCPGVDEPCQMCPDGSNSVACNYGYCDVTRGICKRNGGFCSPKCMADSDCPTPDLACTECGDGTRVCPVAECRTGFCEVSYPGCKGVDPCMGRECGQECQSCADGMCDAAVGSYCNSAGKCQPGAPSCGQNKCQTTMDCGTPPPVCIPCVDGSCASFDCVNNKCAMNCPLSNLQCKYTDECLNFFDGQCKMCPNGMCALPACLQNACQLVCPLN